MAQLRTLSFLLITSSLLFILLPFPSSLPSLPLLPPSLPLSLLPSLPPSLPTPDRPDAVEVFRKRKRLHSEVEEEGEELSLLEYLRRRERNSSTDKKKKRVNWCNYGILWAAFFTVELLIQDTSQMRTPLYTSSRSQISKDHTLLPLKRGHLSFGGSQWQFFLGGCRGHFVPPEKFFAPPSSLSFSNFSLENF